MARRQTRVTGDLLTWDAPGPYRVAFSTREGGVSEGRFASLNLGLLTADEPAHVEANRRRLCDEVGVDVCRLTMNRQVHGAVVHRAVAGARGDPGDGLWTDEPRVPLLALAADCLPVVLARANGDLPAVAVLHVGRAGLLSGILQAGVGALGGDVVAAVGPGIGVCCYEVGREVSRPYVERFGATVVPDGHVDLRRAADLVLRSAGCTSVEHFDECTCCLGERYFSHRRDGGLTGRQGAVASIA